MLQLDLSGKTVLITGVSSGIGAGIALEMARAGANISGGALEEDGGGTLLAGGESALLPGGESAPEAGGSTWGELVAQGVGTLYTACDVTQTEQLEQLVARTIEKFGRIDVLVSNAGGNVFTGAMGSVEADWQRNIDLNLASHWRLARLCKPYLEDSKGLIIIMSSNHAFSTIPGCFPYNVAKTALTGLVRSLAIEWGPAIRTVGLAPGFIDTPGNQRWFDSFADPDGERQRTIGLHPVNRLGTVEEIGGWCVFLASKYASFASGVTYLIDGGRRALMQDKA
jgi:NAD(P)-dependent dehydrogenase (short-subunit alcohol dehydrogenase family)